MILVIDDHNATREVVVRLIKREGYECVGVESGPLALEFVSAHTPELIILDCSMPTMDGLTVLQRMRLDSRLVQVPVVMFSAFDGEARTRALRLGATGYVVKGPESWQSLQKFVSLYANKIPELGGRISSR